MARLTVWLGGLLYLFSGLSSFKQLDPGLRARRTGQVVRRFSGLALAAVALLSLTGVYAALQRFDSLASLWTTPYGQALLVKLGLFSALMFPAAFNLLVYSPAIRDGAIPAPSHPEANPLDRFFNASSLLVFLFVGAPPQKISLSVSTIRVELVLLAALLVPVSLMTSLHPARVVAALSSSAQSGDLHLALSIAPGVVGLNNFSLRLESGGAPLAVAKEVALRFTLGRACRPSELQLAPLGGGLFSAAGSYLSQAGVWQVQAVVRRAGQFDTYASFDLSVQPPAPAPAAPGRLRRTAAFYSWACALELRSGLQAIAKGPPAPWCSSVRFSSTLSPPSDERHPSSLQTNTYGGCAAHKSPRIKISQRKAQPEFSPARPKQLNPAPKLVGHHPHQAQAKTGRGVDRSTSSGKGAPSLIIQTSRLFSAAAWADTVWPATAWARTSISPVSFSP